MRGTTAQWLLRSLGFAACTALLALAPAVMIGESRTSMGALLLAGPTLVMLPQWGHLGRWSSTAFGF